jgi:hypothetical protein
MPAGGAQPGRSTPPAIAMRENGAAIESAGRTAQLGWHQRSRRGRQAAASARRCGSRRESGAAGIRAPVVERERRSTRPSSSAGGGAIAFLKRNRPVRPRADDRYGDIALARIELDLRCGPRSDSPKCKRPRPVRRVPAPDDMGASLARLRSLLLSFRWSSLESVSTAVRRCWSPPVAAVSKTFASAVASRPTE